jgi:uncharacterized protein
MLWKKSHYTHFIALKDEQGAVYNGRTGALVKLSSGAFKKSQKIAKNPARYISDPLFEHLVVGGFLVEENLDELQMIEEQFNRERKRSQFMITILPTFGCNLGCNYCFVGKKKGMMNREKQDEIIAFIEKRLAEERPPSMAVDWFGGEPLLAPQTIEYLSAAFLRLCEKYDIPYSAQVITNGTVIKDEVVEILQRSGVNRMQITLDGLKEVHDVRRPSKLRVISSFDKTVEGLGKVVGKFLIRLRINVDSNNLDHAWGLLDIFERAGWLAPGQHFYPYLARLSPFTDACASAVTEAVPMDRFQSANDRWMRRLHDYGVQVVGEGLYNFPEPKLYNCGAIGNNGFIFNPNGEIHKCGLAVDDSSEAVGMLGEGIDADGHNFKKWQEWTPFQNEVCRSCEFLPSCLGGCPRNKMQMREVQIKENCEYYQQHENKILATHLELAGI